MMKIMETLKHDFLPFLGKRKSSDNQIGSSDVVKELEKLNKFMIFDSRGELVREGTNIVLNIGRLVTSSRLLKRTFEIPAGITTDGLAKIVTMEHDVSLVAFGVGNGAALQSDAFSPRLPIPSDIGLTVLDESHKWLYLSSDIASVESPDGYPYGFNTRIKEYVNSVNPVSKTDDDGFDYVEHTLVVHKDELVGAYFNEICLFFKVTDGSGSYYVPYSKFSFESLPNLGGLNSYTILYGTYL